MNKISFYIFNLIICFLLMSCNTETGYVKKNGKWKWKYYHGGNFNYEFREIDSINQKEFYPLSENFAKDDKHVYHQNSIIENADVNSFEIISKGYSKDRNNVFLDDQTVIFANPLSFELLEFPYSTDSKRVFCGTLPIEIKENEVKEFKVTNNHKLPSTVKSTTLVSHFTKINKGYKWLDTLKIKAVIYGEYGTGETLNKKIQGFKVIEK